MKFEFNFSPKPKTSLMDRALNDLSNIAGGFFPGLAEIGAAATSDAYAAMPFTPNKFRLPDLAKRTGKAMWEESALPPLLLGAPQEALKRANERPVSTLLDLSLLAPATTGAARLGARTGIGRDSSLDFLGYDRVSNPTIAEQLRNVLDPLNTDFKRTDAPAAIQLDNSGAQPLREWLPTTGSNPLSFGDDLYLRQTKRTLFPKTQSPVVIDRDYTKEDLALQNYEYGITPGQQVAGRMYDEYHSPEQMLRRNQTLGEDPYFLQTSYRAKNEGIAQLGDLTQGLLDKIPSGRWYSNEDRLGKNIVRNAQSEKRIESDRAMSGVIKRVNEAAKAYAAEHPDVSVEQAKVLIANRDYIRSLGLPDDSPESLTEFMSQFDGLHDVMKDPQEAWFVANAMPLTEAYDRFGIRIGNSKNGPDYAYHNDPQFSGMRLADFLAQKHEEIRKHKDVEDLDENGLPKLGEDGQPLFRQVPDSPIEFQAIARNHRKAAETYASDRSMAEIMIFEATRKMAESGFAPILTHVKTGETIDLTGDAYDSTGVIDVTLDGKPRDSFPQGWTVRGDVLEKLLGNESGEWSVSFVHKDNEMPVNKPEKDDAVKSFIKAVSNVRASRKVLNTYNQHAAESLAGLRMYGQNAQFAPRSERKLGIVKKLEEIRDNVADPQWKHESLDELLKYLDGLRAKGAIHQREMLGDNLFSPEAQARAEQRGANWVRGDQQGDAQFEDAIFYPMVSESSAPVGKKERDKLGAEAILYPHEKSDSLGDPFEVFLKGEFRTDWETVLNDFQRNLQYKAGHDILKSIKGLAMSIPREQYERLKVHGKEVSEADALEGRTFQGAYVAVPEDGAYSRLFSDLNELLTKFEIHASADDHPWNVSDISKVRQMAQHFNMRSPDNVDMSKNLADIPASTVREKGPDADEVKVLPADIYHSAYREMELSRRAMNAIIENGTQIWKWTVLHARFLGWMRNNIIGAHLMVAMAGGPMNYLRTVGQMTKEGHGDIHRLLMEEMPEVYGSGSATQAREINMSPEHTAKGKIERKAINPLSEINAKYADDPAREIRLMQLMQEQLDMGASLNGRKAEDLTIEDVKRFMEDDLLRKELAQRTKTDMVDFTDMTEREKRYLRSIFPFYSWMKGSTKATQRVAADHPGRVWAAAEISDVGEQEQLEDHGHFVPDFAKTWWDPGEAGGFAINTAGMLPYQTGVDLASQAMGLVPNIGLPGTDEKIRLGPSYLQFGSENLFSGANPILTGLAEAATGRDLYFGTPTPQDSFGSSFLAGQANVPPVQFLQKLLRNETGPDATTEYHPGLASLNYLAGVPLTIPRWGKTRSRAVDELNERYKSPLAWRELSLGDV